MSSAFSISREPPTIQVVRYEDLTTAEITAWSSIQQQEHAFAHPFFSSAFTEAAAAARGDIRIAVIGEPSDPAGFFPFHACADGVAEPVGGRISDYQGVIARRNLVWDVETLFRRCEIRKWSCRHMIASQYEFLSWQEKASRSLVVDLSRGTDAWIQYLSSKGSRIISKIERSEKTLEREHGPLNFEVHSPSTHDLHSLMTCKSAQYQLTDRTDRFATAWIRRILEEVHALEAPRCFGTLSILSIRGETVAAHFGLRSATVWHYWFPCYTRRFAAYSPGLILLLKMIRHAATLGIQYFDLGAGEGEYKLRLMNSEVALAEVNVELG